MKHPRMSSTRLFRAFFSALVFCLCAQPLLAQNGTLNNGFLIRIDLPNGQHPLYAPVPGGFGAATFGATLDNELELGIAWARTAGGDSLACTPLANISEITGKAALIRRGGCNFQAKANNAENAGALAMLVINHTLNPGETDDYIQNMTPTAGLPDVGIPCIFLSRSAGDQIVAALDAGLPVKIRFVFPRLTDGVSAYHFATPLSQLRDLGNMGVTYRNRSTETEEGVVVKAEIIEPDGNVLTQTIDVPSMPPGTFIDLTFPSYTPPALKGRFDVVYTNNKHKQTYDTVRSSFILTDHSYATDNFQPIPNGAGPDDQTFAASGFAYRTGGLCVTGSQGATATHVTFGITNAAEIFLPADPLANTVFAFVFDADVDGDFSVDPFFDFFDMPLVGLGAYVLTGSEAPDELINMPLSDLFNGEPFVTLAPDHLYYVALSYDGPIGGTGKSIRFGATGPVTYLNFPTTPLFLNDLYSGWSDATVISRLQLGGFDATAPQPPVPPIAAFSAAVSDFDVVFANNSLDADSYVWDFGDGSGATDTNPAHTYTTAGIYTVKLIATNEGGSHAAVRSIRVGPVVPVSASFTADQTSGCAPLSVSFNSTSTGTDLTYLWSFPGGNPAFSTLPNPVVAYTAAGSYNVSLQVGDGITTSTVTNLNQVTVGAAPQASFTATQATDSSYQFMNESSDATSYFWDFGDGSTGAAPSPTHTYSVDGIYLVTLIASGTCGVDTFTSELAVFLPPVAAFSADATNGCAPFTVQFTSLSSAGVTAHNWVFPGGTPISSTEPNPVVVYEMPGMYSVLLGVSSPGGQNSVFLPDYIIVDGLPDAGFSFNTDTSSVTFANASQNADSYLWDFGDGSSSPDASPTHTYGSSGSFEVVLTAVNACGASTATQTVTITSGAGSPVLDAWKISVTPNPASDHLQVRLNLSAENERVQLTLLDALGRRVVRQEHARLQQAEVLLPVYQLPACIYQLQVLCEEGMAVRKILVQR